jgi:hypothetical protein
MSIELTALKHTAAWAREEREKAITRVMGPLPSTDAYHFTRGYFSAIQDMLVVLGQNIDILQGE